MVCPVISVQFHIITLGLVEHLVIHEDFWGLPMERQRTGVYHSKPGLSQKGMIFLSFYTLGKVQEVEVDLKEAITVISSQKWLK